MFVMGDCSRKSILLVENRKYYAHNDICEIYEVILRVSD